MTSRISDSFLKHFLSEKKENQIKSKRETFQLKHHLKSGNSLFKDKIN